MVFAYYHDCDPIGARQVEKKDQIFPLFVMQVLANLFYSVNNSHEACDAGDG